MTMINIDVLIGKNLKRIRESHNLSQPKLAEMIGTTAQRMSAYETGRDGMGKDYMERVCQALDVEPWEFYVSEKTPIIKDEQEQEALSRFRRAQAAGVAEDAAEYAEYKITVSKKKGKTGNEGTTVGLPRDTSKRK